MVPVNDEKINPKVKNNDHVTTNKRLLSIFTSMLKFNSRFRLLESEHVVIFQEGLSVTYPILHGSILLAVTVGFAWLQVTARVTSILSMVFLFVFLLGIIPTVKQVIWMRTGGSMTLTCRNVDFVLESTTPLTRMLARNSSQTSPSLQKLPSVTLDVNGQHIPIPFKTVEEKRGRWFAYLGQESIPLAIERPVTVTIGTQLVTIALSITDPEGKQPPQVLTGLIGHATLIIRIKDPRILTGDEQVDS